MRASIWLVRLCAVAALAAFWSAPARCENRIALVIGNSAYVNIPSLANPLNDARLVANTLRDLGFRLVGGDAQVNLDKVNFDRAVQAFGAQLQGADVGLFYYAGHGVQVRGVNYLIPVDANPVREADVDFQTLDSNLVLRQMEAAGTRLNLVILDACRNNPLGGRGLRAVTSGLAQIQAPEGTLISFATQPGNVAIDGDDGHSPYTKALAQTIRRPGIGVFDAFNEVGLLVKRATGGAQQPWVSSSPISGSFFFAGSPANDGALAPRPPSRPSPAPAADELLWQTIKDSLTAAVFEEFLNKFPSSPRAREARARLDELTRGQVAVVAPPARLPPRSNEPPAPQDSVFCLIDDTRPPDDWLALRTLPTGASGRQIIRMRNGTPVRVLERRPDGWWRLTAKVDGAVYEGWALNGQYVQGVRRQWIHCSAARR